MDNKEDVLDALEGNIDTSNRFNNQSPSYLLIFIIMYYIYIYFLSEFGRKSTNDNVPPILEEYLLSIARTGETL